MTCSRQIHVFELFWGESMWKSHHLLSRSCVLLCICLNCCVHWWYMFFTYMIISTCFAVYNIARNSQGMGGWIMKNYMTVVICQNCAHICNMFIVLIGSMYGIFTSIYHTNQPNVGKFIPYMEQMGFPTCFHPAAYVTFPVSWLDFRTSITIPDIICVVDSGLARVKKHTNLEASQMWIRVDAETKSSPTSIYWVPQWNQLHKQIHRSESRWRSPLSKGGFFWRAYDKSRHPWEWRSPVILSRRYL